MKGSETREFNRSAFIPSTNRISDMVRGCCTNRISEKNGDFDHKTTPTAKTKATATTNPIAKCVPWPKVPITSAHAATAAPTIIVILTAVASSGLLRENLSMATNQSSFS